jgi:dipeptide/tripeptide permease
MVFSWIYQAGMVMLALSAGLPGLTPQNDNQKATFGQFLFLYLSLYVIALGTGGIKPNVSAFGADQFDPRDPVEKADKESFFNWFYLSVNLGSLIGEGLGARRFCLFPLLTMYTSHFRHRLYICFC